MQELFNVSSMPSRVLGDRVRGASIAKGNALCEICCWAEGISKPTNHPPARNPDPLGSSNSALYMLDERWRAFCWSGNLAIQNFQAMGTIAGLQRLINTNVVMCHARGRKPRLKTTAHTTSIQGEERSHLKERFVDTVDDIARDTLVDHLGHRTMPEGKNGGAAGHGLYHDKAERLRPVDGKEQRESIAEEFAFWRARRFRRCIRCPVG